LRRAITEAPIIVGSILLAFAIDAGWGARSERIDRHEILEGLRAEFVEHREAYPRLIERAEERMADMQLLMSGEEALTAGLDRVNRSIFQLLIVTTKDPGRGVRDALISSGKLEIIRDVELRMRLADWEGVVDEVRDNQEVMRRLVASQLVPYLAAEGVPLAGAFSENGPTHHLWPPSLEWPRSPQLPPGDEAIYRRVLADSEFQSYVSLRYLWLAWTVTELGEAVSEIDQILSGLTKELEGA
jgi:hypothetical protein